MTHATAGSLPYGERRVRDRRTFAGIPLWRTHEGMRISWGGINGGVLLAVGLLILLAALGIAVGISAADPGRTDTNTLGTTAAIWSGISLLAALFLGGYASTKLSATTDATTGFFEGALVWVVSMLFVLYLAGSGIGVLANGAFQLVGGAGQAVESMVNADPANSAAADLAEDVRRSLDGAVAEARAPGALNARAEAMRPEATTAAWITFMALVLSLVASIAGGLVGRRRPETERTRTNN